MVISIQLPTIAWIIPKEKIVNKFIGSIEHYRHWHIQNHDVQQSEQSENTTLPKKSYNNLFVFPFVLRIHFLSFVFFSFFCFQIILIERKEYCNQSIQRFDSMIQRKKNHNCVFVFVYVWLLCTFVCVSKCFCVSVF